MMMNMLLLLAVGVRGGGVFSDNNVTWNLLQRFGHVTSIAKCYQLMLRENVWEIPFKKFLPGNSGVRIVAKASFNKVLSSATDSLDVWEKSPLVKFDFHH